MRKILLVVGLVVFAACTKTDITVSNDCYGSWARVIDGSGNVVSARLNYGETVVVQTRTVTSTNGGSIQLTANGFKQVGDVPLGSTSTTIWVSGTNTGPQYSRWSISGFNGTYQSGGCYK